MERNRTFDIMKGIGILSVILGHMDVAPFWRTFIFSFHMPLFFILAGYFYRSHYTIAEEARKDAKRLLSPYAFTMSILFLYIVSIHGLLLHDNYLQGGRFLLTLIFLSGGYGALFAVPLWFLPALFWTKQLYNLVQNKSGEVIFCIFLSLLAYVGSRFVELPFALFQGVIGLLFFIIGVWAKKGVSKRWIYLFILCWALAMGLNAFGFEISSIDMMHNNYRFLPLDVIVACGGTAAVYGVSTVLDRKTNYTARLLAWFGRFSIVILCAHTIERFIPLWNALHITNLGLLFAVKVAFCSLAVLICLRIPFTRKVFQLA